MKCVVVLATLCVAAACREAVSPAPARTSVIRHLGAWQGVGSQTIGVVSESGRLRVTWKTSKEIAAGPATFRLALHSAVSGRPIQLIADHRGGEGNGTVDVIEDPRPYNLMVDSANLSWSFTVDEIVADSSRR